MNLLEKGVVPGKTNTIVEYSSGSTVISMSLVARAIYDIISDVRAFLSNKPSDAKLKLMRFFGLNLYGGNYVGDVTFVLMNLTRTLFGGHSQLELVNERGGICAAKKLAQQAKGIINPNQYENDDVIHLHVSLC